MLLCIRCGTFHYHDMHKCRFIIVRPISIEKKNYIKMFKKNHLEMKYINIVPQRTDLYSKLVDFSLTLTKLLIYLWLYNKIYNFSKLNLSLYITARFFDGFSNKMHKCKYSKTFIAFINLHLFTKKIFRNSSISKAISTFQLKFNFTCQKINYRNSINLIKKARK